MSKLTTHNIVALQEYRSLTRKVNSRINYIVVTITMIFNKAAYNISNVSTYNDICEVFDNFEPSNPIETKIEFVNRNIVDNNMLADIKEAENWNFLHAFPARYLYEDFENEVTEAIKKRETRLENQRLEQLKNNKQIQKTEEEKKKSLLMQEIKKKLTKEELALLKIG